MVWHRTYLRPDDEWSSLSQIQSCGLITATEPFCGNYMALVVNIIGHSSVLTAGTETKGTIGSRTTIERLITIGQQHFRNNSQLR